MIKPVYLYLVKKRVRRGNSASLQASFQVFTHLIRRCLDELLSEQPRNKPVVKIQSLLTFFHSIQPVLRSTYHETSL